MSLYPSGTETLYALGAAPRVVGRTSWCPVPAAGPAPPAMGGTKDPDLGAIRAAAPDLVLACRDENRREDVEAIAGFAPVAVADPRRVADVPGLLRDLAAATAADETAAGRLAAAIEDEAAGLEARVVPRRRALTFIWRGPWWTLGSVSYAADILRLCGLDNAFASDPRPYFEVDAAAIATARPDVLLFPDEPFPFRGHHAEALRAEIPVFRLTPMVLFEGALLTWHGARTLEALRRLPAILRPPAEIR